MLIKIKQGNMDHGAKQSRSKPRYTKSKRNTNKLVRVKTGPGVIEKIGKTVGGAFKPKTEKPTTTTPPQNEMTQSQILNTETPAQRLASQFGGLNQDTMQAMVAGGSRPMHQVTSSQIDPMTGMPIVPGGQPPINPAFSGAIQNSGIPNYNPGMNMGALAQARLEMSRDEKKAQIMSRDLPDEVKENMIDGINQERQMMKTMKPLPRAKPDRSDSTAMFMGGNAPGQYNNPIWKPAADSAKVRFPGIDPDKIKSSDIYKKGDQLHTLTRNLPIVNKRYGTEELSKKAFDKAMVDQQRYKIGNKGPRKSMVVKRNK